MKNSQKIKMALAYKGMRESELARQLGTTPQAFNQRMKTDKFTGEEMDTIAKLFEKLIDDRIETNVSNNSNV